MPRTVVMGDPTYFSVIGGANPHTRNSLGMKKRVDANLARQQWHAMAKALIAHGAEVCVIPPQPRLTGLVYPANAGFLYPLEAASPDAPRQFYLSNLLPTRAAERDVYGPFVRSMGYPSAGLKARFEGEADFFPAGDFMIFTHGKIETQRFMLRVGLPPWRRIYGFRSEIRALEELREATRGRAILALQLTLEAHYHGDTVMCSFGPRREFVLAYMDGLDEPSQRALRNEFGRNLIELEAPDAALYAANAFQTDFEGKQYLFLPAGVSEGLLGKIREHAVEPVQVEVSEFLAKGGGSVKCMILDLGPREQQPAEGVAFRTEHSYPQLFASEAARAQS